ncbi:MAG TPA: hypothetical protein DEP11_00165 [Candidatus Jacksonbacteria bacterium]|nr:hypothetical protein [Candidatus Jacksonbacteria bacterium]
MEEKNTADMMTKRAFQKIVLVFIIVALALIAWGLIRSSSIEDQAILPKLSFDKSVNRIEIAFGGKTTTLVKQGEKWEAKEGDSVFPADTTAVDSVLGTLSKLELQDIVSKNKDRYEDFEIGDSSALIISWLKNDEERGKMYIGGQDYARGGDYARIGEAESVYLTREPIRSYFARGSFKNLGLVEISDAALVSKVAWEYPDAAVSMTLLKKNLDKDAEEWIFENDSGVLVNQDAVKTFLSFLASFQADDIKKYDASAEYGFVKPVLTVRATIDGKEEILAIGGKTSDGSSYYARVSGRDLWVYLIGSQLVNDQLMKRRADFEKKEDKSQL